MATSGISKKRSFGKMEINNGENDCFGKRILQEGEGENTPGEGSRCIVYLYDVGEDMNEVDMGHFVFNAEVTVTIGDAYNRVAEIIEEAICTMKEGEIAYCVIEPPKESTTDFDQIEKPSGKEISELSSFSSKNQKYKVKLFLKSFTTAFPSVTELNPDDALARAADFKKKGSELYSKQNIIYAVKKYKKALDCMLTLTEQDQQQQNATSSESHEHDRKQDASTGEQNERNLLLTQIYLNLAACYLKTDQNTHAKEMCEAGLKFDPKNVKGLFRLGQACAKLEDYTNAIATFSEVITLDKDNKAAIAQRKQLEDMLKRERKMYTNMFSS